MTIPVHPDSPSARQDDGSLRKERVTLCLRGLYGMVDTTASPSRTHRELAESLLTAGCTVLQLRAKSLNLRDFRELAEVVAGLCARRGALFIVNDHLEVSRAIPGAGLHIGEDDGHPRQIREALPPDRILGVSTHDAEEVRNATRWGADYVGFGPVFSGATKGSPRPPRGIDGLREAVRKASLPVVAIGRLTLENVPDVILTGATAGAVIADIHAHSDPLGRARAHVLAWQGGRFSSGAPS